MSKGKNSARTVKLSIISTSDARVHFPTTLRQVEQHGERFVIQNHGRGVAAIIPLEDLARLEKLDKQPASRP